jgi:transcription-repair coupling factor (superfamily II helicase)
MRMYAAGDARALDLIFSELRDRFGPVPEETMQLFTAVRLRLAAMPTGAQRLSFRDGVMRLDLPPESSHEFYDRWFQPVMYAISRDSTVRLETKGKALSVIFKGIETLEDAEGALAGFIARMREGIMETESR